MREKYVPLCNEVRDTKGYSGLAAILAEKPEERALQVRTMLIAAAKRFADEEALLLLGWFMKARREMIPRPEVPVRDNGYLTDEEMKTLGAYEAQVVHDLAREFIQLFGELPEKMPKDIRVMDDMDSGHWEKADAPTLPKTKAAIFATLANCWRDATDEEVADACFKFLTKPELRLVDEFGVREKEVRRVTDDRFPLPRLLRTLFAITDPNDPYSPSGAQRVLTMGAAKTIETKKLIAFLRIGEPLLGASVQAEALARMLTEEVAVFDKTVAELRKRLEEARAWNRENIKGQLEFEYAALDAVGVTIKNPKSDSLHTYGANTGHDDFGKVERVVRGYLEDTKASLNVTVNLAVKLWPQKGRVERKILLRGLNGHVVRHE